MPEVEIYKTGQQTGSVDDLVTVRVGESCGTLTMGEWSRLIVRPLRPQEPQYPGGIDDMEIG